MALFLRANGGRSLTSTMSNGSDPADRHQLSRRTVIEASSAATATTALGLFGATSAHGQTTEADGGGGDGTDAHAWVSIGKFRGGAIIRVESPPIDETPAIEGAGGPDIERPTGRIVQYFNTGEETLVYLPGSATLEQGALYHLTEDYQLTENGDGRSFVRVGIRRLDNQDLAFDLTDEDLELVTDSGGEAAIRPRDFSAGALFRLTSAPLGWVPTDVVQSGYFSEYDTRRAQYVGIDDGFLFFPQEAAQVQTDVLYVLHDEFELLNPAGNLVAASFRRVSEESLPAGDYIP